MEDMGKMVELTNEQNEILAKHLKKIIKNVSGNKKVGGYQNVT